MTNGHTEGKLTAKGAVLLAKLVLPYASFRVMQTFLCPGPDK